MYNAVFSVSKFIVHIHVQFTRSGVIIGFWMRNYGSVIMKKIASENLCFFIVVLVKIA